MTDIRLNLAPSKARCDTCLACNYFDDETHEIPAAIYELHIGAGFRQPSYLCPDCLNRLRELLGREITIDV